VSASQIDTPEQLHNAVPQPPEPGLPDAHELRRLEERLRESEERFHDLFDDAPVACHEIGRDGVVMRVNQVECSLLGFAPGDMVGHHIWEFLAPGEREKSQNAVRRMVFSGWADAPFEREYTRNDGTTLVLEVHPKLIRDAANQVAGIRSFTFDITARKRAEQALWERAQELARSNTELEQFAYVASHDLQEPLRKILAFGDRLKSKCAGPLGAEGSDYLARMQNAAARMQTLIHDLLSLSRVASHAQPLVAVDLAEVARTVVSDLEPRMEQLGARVEVDPLPVIVADRGQMAQLLQNLIGNGLKFHKPGEAPIVRVRGELRNGQHGAEGVCQIFVEDNGIGFDEKYLSRIFQVFQRLHGRNEYEGTGIGLAICRKIAERHGGSLTAASAPGMGAKFTVTLPYRPQTQEIQSE
jgi:PAS domain S-box-containing protein